MIDLDYWICSRDIADWLRVRPPLDPAEQVDCILSAPHRHLEEKLEGLQKLQREVGSWKPLEDKIDAAETLLEIMEQAGGLRSVYGADVFCHGRREEYLEKRIFTLAKTGADFIKNEIRKEADRYGREDACYFGVLYKYYRTHPRYLELEWNILLDSQSRIIYCLPEYSQLDQTGKIRGNDYWIGPGDYSYMWLPYPTGTVVETAGSPFIRPVKGVVVNQKEPWEEDFAGDNEQWLLYPDISHDDHGAGIGAIPLNDYASVAFGADFLLPFRQLIRRCGRELDEKETWLGNLGELLKKDKSCFALILKDRQPGKEPGGYETCQAYVEELPKRRKQMWPDDGRKGEKDG